MAVFRVAAAVTMAGQPGSDKTIVSETIWTNYPLTREEGSGDEDLFAMIGKN
jgi:hypothetical protein